MDRVESVTAWLHLTDRCNLKCLYCHLPHEPLDMSIDIALSSVDSLFRVAQKYNSSSIYIKYMGGEPLLMFDHIITISNYTKKMAKERGIELKELIITNGILLNREKTKKIKELNIDLIISLDGLGEYNQQRGDITSTDRVIKSIELAKESGLTPRVSIVVTPHNIQGLPLFVNWLVDMDLGFSLNLVRNNSIYRDKLIEQKIIDTLIETLKIVEKKPNIDFRFDKIDPLKPHSKTCGAGENYLLFNPQGQISKCQMEMQNIVASHQDQNPLKKIREDKNFVKSYNIDEIEECKECDIRYFCTASCPAHTYLKYGEYNRKSPNCNIYKAIYPYLLRLEGVKVLLGV